MGRKKGKEGREEKQKEKERGREERRKGGVEKGRKSGTVEAITQLVISYFLNAFLHILSNNRIYNYINMLSQPHFKQISPQMSKKEPRKHEFVTTFA